MSSETVEYQFSWILRCRANQRVGVGPPGPGAEDASSEPPESPEHVVDVSAAEPGPGAGSGCCGGPAPSASVALSFGKCRGVGGGARCRSPLRSGAGDAACIGVGDSRAHSGQWAPGTLEPEGAPETCRRSPPPRPFPNWPQPAVLVFRAQGKPSGKFTGRGAVREKVIFTTFPPKKVYAMMNES